MCLLGACLFDARLLGDVLPALSNSLRLIELTLDCTVHQTFANKLAKISVKNEVIGSENKYHSFC